MSKNHRSTHRARSANDKVRVERMFPVYAKDRVLGETPLYFINQRTRDEWIEQGAVTTITAYDGSGKARKRTTALRLLLNLPPRPQMSVTMGLALMEGIAAGKLHAREIAEAWDPAYSPYCQYPRQAA